MSVHVTAWVYDHAPDNLSPGDMLVALILADHANGEGGSAYPSVARIAGMSRMNERSVRRSLDRLQACGVIQEVRQPTNKHPAVYRFPLYVRAGNMSTLRGSRVDIYDTLGGHLRQARVDTTPTEPSREPSREPTTATDVSTRNGHHPSRLAAAVGEERFKRIATNFSDANPQLNLAWFRETVTDLERAATPADVATWEGALRNTVATIQDAFGRDNTIKNPRAYVRSELKRELTAQEQVS